MIITDENILRQISENVRPEEVNDLVAALDKELQHSKLMGRDGIGLAAIQIGIAKKAAIIRISDELSINLINAKIEKQYNPTPFKEEGCLSYPNELKDTLRYQEIVVSNDVMPHHFVATGLLAIAIQHELDHTNGIIFSDREIKKEIKVKAKMKPNDKCSCGSNKKYKKCCGL